MSARVTRRLTLIAALPESLCAKYSRHDLLGKLFTALKLDDVCCIQFVSKRYVRITLKTLNACHAVLLSGITIESFRLTVFEADPVSVKVSLEYLPFEVPDEDLRDALIPYGAIHNVRLQKYADFDVYTGTRILTMSLASDIPVNLRVLGYPCRVLYRGQPRPCPVCRSDGHRASACPLRDKCRRCLQPGHFVRERESAAAESDPSFVPDDASAAAAADDDDDDDVDDDDDDDDMQSEEFANGDEEAVEATSAPTLPPMPVSSSVPSNVDKEPAAAASVASPVTPVQPSVPENVPPDDVASRVKRRVKSV